MKLRLGLQILQAKVENGTATEEEKATLETEIAILRYSAKKEAKKKKAEAPLKFPPFKKTFDIKAYQAKYKDDHKAELLEKKKAYYEKNKEELRRKQREYARKKREAEKIMAKLAEIKALADDADTELDYCHVTGVISNDSRFKIRGAINTLEALLVDLLSEKATKTEEPATAGLRRCMVNGQPGMFHRWGDYAMSTNADEAHIIKGVIGIVEMEDGSITEAHPLSIAFEKPRTTTTLYCDGRPFAEVEEVKEG